VIEAPHWLAWLVDTAAYCALAALVVNQAVDVYTWWRRRRNGD
jgi:hypothetical protein